MFKDNPFKENKFLSEYYNKMVEVFTSTNKHAESETASSDRDPGSYTSPDYSTYKVTELKAEAKARGYKGYTRLKKSELIDLLNKNQ